MPTNVQVLNYADMTGGLNVRSDPFQLAPNESPDMLNVDIDPRGGIRLRKGITTFADQLAGDAHSIGAFETTDASKQQVIIGVGQTVAYSSGTTFTDTLITLTASDSLRMVSFKDKLYIQNGTDSVQTWDGTTAGTPLGTSYNEDFTGPGSGNMPVGKLMAVFQNHVFVANTSESGNRIRFSHPNQPEDYRAADYFDVDTGVDGDVITALVPNGDRLLVFKRHSIHAIYGYDYTSWQVVPVSHDIGTIRQESVVSSDAGVYFFSWPNGVFRIVGSKLEWLFEPLLPLITDGTIDDDYQDKITLGWGKRRLWVSVPFEGSTVNRCFVLDPSLGKSGSWVQYDTAVGPFLEWRPAASSTSFLACGVGTSRIDLLEQTRSTDNLGINLLTANQWSIETDTSGWTNNHNATLAKSATFAKYETNSLRLTAIANGSFMRAQTTPTTTVSVTPGQRYTASVFVRADTGSNDASLTLYWRDADDSANIETNTVSGTSTAGVWTELTYSGICPDAVAYLRLGVDFGVQSSGTVTLGEIHYVDGATIYGPAVHITSYYRTPWIFLKQPAVKKRWKRPVITLRSGDPYTLSVVVYKDFSTQTAIRSYTISTSGVVGSYKWGAGPDYVWGGGTWTAKSAVSNELVKGSSMGIAQAIALKISGPGTNTSWSLDSISFKHVPRPIR